MREQEHNREQFSELPTMLPTRAYNRRDLVCAAASDEAYSPLARLETLRHLTERFFEQREHPGALNSSLIAALSHRFIKLAKSLDFTRRDDCFAELSKAEHPFSRLIVPFVIDRIQDFCPAELSNMAWAARTLGIESRALWDCVASRAREVMPHFNGLDVANLTWVFVGQEQHYPDIPQRLAEQTTTAVRTCATQGISSLAWSFAKMGVRDERLFAALSSEFKTRFEDASPRALASMAWAFGSVGISDPELMHGIASEILHRQAPLNHKDLSNLVWAQAKLNCPHQGLQLYLADRIIRRIDDFTPHGLANVAWGFASLDVRNNELFAALSRAAQRALQAFSGQGLTNFVWAYAKIGIRDEALMSAIADETVRRGVSEMGRELPIQCWGLAMLGITHDPLFELAARASAGPDAEIKKRELSLVAWSLGFNNEHLIPSVVQPEMLDEFVSDPEWLQAYQAMLITGQVSPTARFARYEEFAGKLIKAPPNEFELCIEEELMRAGVLPHEIERRQHVGGVFSDLVVQRNGRVVAVQCDRDRTSRGCGDRDSIAPGRSAIHDKIRRVFGQHVVRIVETEYLENGPDEMMKAIMGALGPK